MGFPLAVEFGLLTAAVSLCGVQTLGLWASVQLQCMGLAARGMRDFLRPGIELVSPALQPDS